MTQKTPLERARGLAKRDFMAHSFHIAKVLKNTALHIELRLDELEGHHITEFEVMKDIIDTVQSISVEIGLGDLVHKWAEFQFKDGVLRAVRNEGQGGAA